MKFLIPVIFCLLSLSASAQWYRIDLRLLKKRERLPILEQLQDHSIARIPVAKIDTTVKLQPIKLDRSEFVYDAAIYFAIQKAQHSMRYHMNTDASYNFSDLAHLYLLQNKFSEAKWYLLQSNNISRQQKDNQHTIANLIDLAMIKANSGEFILAQQDLAEAHHIAGTTGFLGYLPQIEQKMALIKQNKSWPSTPEQANILVASNVTKIE